MESTQAVAHLRESFAERYEAFVSQQPKAQDPLDLTEEEEQQLKTFHENLDADAADVASLVKACEKFDSALLQGIKAHPVSPLVRRAVWNPPAGKAVEALLADENLKHRKSFGLLSRATRNWSKRCSVHIHAKQKPILKEDLANRFRPDICFSLGICVCVVGGKAPSQIFGFSGRIFCPGSERHCGKASKTRPKLES